jgi:hypothetical protein
MARVRICSFGPVLVAHDAAMLAACPEIGSFPEAGQGGAPHLTITLADELPPFAPTHYVGKRRLAFDARALQVRFEPPVSYFLEDAFVADAPTRLVVCLGAAAKTTRLKNAATSLEARLFQLKGVIEGSPIAAYSLLWYVMHLALWKLGASFAHGAAWEHAGRATVLFGSGGCGKTSSLLTMRQRGLAQYLAEDFVILDEAGRAHPSPKSVTLYRSDLEATGTVAVAGAARRLVTRTSLGIVAANPKFKVLPSEAFGPLAPSAVPIRHAVFVARTSEAQPRFDPISAAELARRAALASLRELKPLSELLQMISANAPRQFSYPSPEEHARQVEERYARALASASTHLLWAPEHFPPGELVDFMQAHGVIDGARGTVG